MHKTLQGEVAEQLTIESITTSKSYFIFTNYTSQLQDCTEI